MIPDGIEVHHLEAAIREINENGVPSPRQSVHYDYMHGNKRYPPKYVISLATKYAFGEELSSEEFNAVRARDYLRARGYTVLDRRDENLEVVVDEDDESAFAEGASQYKRHRTRERDSGIAKKAKAKALQDTGKLECETCGFDFYETYGQLGLGFIEAHHKVPLSELNGESGKKTKLSDLALVCSNCHRMLHRQRETMSVEKLKERIQLYT